MINLRDFAILAVVSSIAATGANAQTLANSKGPANTPPDTYGGLQFVDSKGCVFVRSGYAGKVTWVPRVDRKRRQLCDSSYLPTFGDGKVAEAQTGGGLFAKKTKPAELEELPEPSEETSVATVEEKPKKPKKGLFAKRVKPAVTEETVSVPVAEPEVVEKVAKAPAKTEETPKVRKPLFGLGKKKASITETADAPMVLDKPKPVAKIETPAKKPKIVISKPAKVAVEEPVEAKPVKKVAKAPKPKKIAKPKPVKTQSFKEGYYVRVANFSNADKASETLEWFKTSGHRGLITPVGAKSELNVGPFSSAAAAKAALYQAVGAGYKSAKIVRH
ncbi:hypothetical protein GCM10008927_20660 [Amylibacter ulvae]|uniref:SPOR domain-containing protein n=2 Tax=Paramylibacter ulvae TaxID=1651968 RepID=A0ABQ3D2X2_9RHOB|nr:hypothetical protein GCM10008927_20660 [Amylibacter ulvae]